MKKKVLIEVEGIQKDEHGEEVRISNSYEGVYSVIDNKCYLVYDEASGQDEQITHNLVHIGISEVSVTKKGNINTKMEFVSGKKRSFSYGTAYGKLPMELFTKNLMITTDDKRIHIIIDYRLELGGDLISNNRLTIKATTV